MAFKHTTLKQNTETITKELRRESYREQCTICEAKFASHPQLIYINHTNDRQHAS